MTPLAAALLLLAASSGAAARPLPGDPAPSFSLPSTGGGLVSLSQFKGRSVVLAFFPKAFTSG